MKKDENGYSKGKEIGILQNAVVDLQRDVTQIITNDLVHIRTDIQDIKVMIARYIGGGAVILALIQILIKFVR